MNKRIFITYTYISMTKAPIAYVYGIIQQVPVRVYVP